MDGIRIATIKAPRLDEEFRARLARLIWSSSASAGPYAKAGHSAGACCLGVPARYDLLLGRNLALGGRNNPQSGAA
jgi:hypothetical protein